MQDLSDNELVQKYILGTPEALDILIQRYFKQIFFFSKGYVKQDREAEDVTQEAFMVLMRGEPAYDDTRGTVRAFLLGVARNHVLRRLKQERYFVAVEEHQENLSSAGAVNGHLAAQSRNETIESVRKAVLSLPEHYREVIVLCELQEMSYGDTAQILGCAIGTVRSRLHRGRAMLLEKLHPAREESAKAENVKSARCFA